MQTFAQRNRVLLLHLSFWLVYVSFLAYQISNRGRGRDFSWDSMIMFIGVQLFFTLLVTYLNYFLLLPRFLRLKKLWLYLIEFIPPFVLIVAARILTQRYLIGLHADEVDSHIVSYFYSSMYTVQTTSIMLFIVIFVGMLRFAVDWFELEAKRHEMENQRLISELNFLKAQINPHFLFNTLNNLYYLVFTKSDNATEVISKLSQMMRYMIYETNHQKVSMSREIEYMNNYIDLEKMRLNDQIPITLTIKGDTDKAVIVPLIFITFLENAFKHGVSNNKPNAWVRASIEVSNGQCIYTVENSKLTGAPIASGKPGIGLQNVRRRLELSYPDKHELNIMNEKEKFRIELKLQLS